MFTKIFPIAIVLFIAFSTAFLYLIILGVSMNKTDMEKQKEDEEQSEYLRNYKLKK